MLSLELILLGSGVEIDRNDPTLGYQHQAEIDFLKSDGGMSRIENASKAWQPDAALMHGLSDIGGIFNPLGLASYETYRGGMGDRGSALYNFLGTKYVLANKDQPPGDASFVPVFNGDPQIDVYLNTNALPRAQLIDRVVNVRSGEEAWQAIHTWAVVTWRLRFPRYLFLLYPAIIFMSVWIALRSLGLSLMGRSAWKGRVLTRPKIRLV